jgi:hypothetical protein
MTKTWTSFEGWLADSYVDHPITDNEHINAQPSLRQQAEAVELAALNLRGHIENLTDLVSKGSRPKHELEICLMRYPALNAAAKTLAALVSDRQTEQPR